MSQYFVPFRGDKTYLLRVIPLIATLCSLSIINPGPSSPHGTGLWQWGSVTLISGRGWGCQLSWHSQGFDKFNVVFCGDHATIQEIKESFHSTHLNTSFLQTKYKIYGFLNEQAGPWDLIECLVPWPLASVRLNATSPLLSAPFTILWAVETGEWPKQYEITHNTPCHCKLLYGCLKIW